MTERVRRNVRHPIAKRYPAEPPPRIEMQIRRGVYDAREDPYAYSDVVCDCFPRTSTHTIPSMFYDKIVCPHTHKSHIQPAQEHQFNYPWTTESLGRRREDDELSDRLSLISEEDEQLRFTPQHRSNSRQQEELSINTAPPYWFKREAYPRTHNPPYTAPVNNMDIVTGTRKATSMKDVRDPGFRTDDAEIQGRRNVSRSGFPQHSRLSNRQFTGNYIDPSTYLL